MRLFQQDAYISMDFLEKNTEIFRLNMPGELPPASSTAMEIDLGDARGKRVISFDKPEIPEINAIQMELQTFSEAIINSTTPAVTIKDGYMALKVAKQIVSLIAKNQLS